MKVTLRNFGVWHDKSFEFPDNGLTLICGPSGRGKTTIFRAINYAITGEGTKLPSHGERQCSVTFEYDGIKIVRTNTPKRVLFTDKKGTTTEGVEAQSLIYQHFGKHFALGGYIHQKGENSFLSMTPAAKLEFLESIIFEETSVDKLKDKLRDNILLADQTLKNNTANIESLLSLQIDKPQPVDTKLSQEDIPKEMDRINKQMAELNEAIEIACKRIQTANTLIQKRKAAQDKLSTLPTIDPPSTIPESTIKQLKERLEEFTRYEKYLSDVQTRVQHQKSVDNFEREIGNLEMEIANIDKSLGTLFGSSNIADFVPSLKTRKADLVSQNMKYKSLVSLRDKREQTKYDQAQLDKLVATLKEKENGLTYYQMGKDVKYCPKCKSCIRVTQSGLEEYNGDSYSEQTYTMLKGEIALLQKQCTDMRVKKSVFDSLANISPDDETFIREYNEAQNARDIQEVDNMMSIYQQQCTRREVHQKEKMTKQNNPQYILAKKALSTPLIEVPTPQGQKDKILQEYHNALKTNQDAIETRNKIAKIEETKMMLNKELANIGEPENVQELYEANLKNSRLLSQLKESLIKLHIISNSYSKYNTDLKAYNDHQTSISSMKERQVLYEKKYSNLVKFKEAIMKSEMIAMQTLIDEINTHLQHYLDLFFPDNPITIDVCLFKENEKKQTVKSQVNIRVGYRGNECELSTLSGGEQDRVNLAFTLALADIFHLPFLLLDETLSSLDGNTAENILENVQRESRALLVIAHQATSGTFDHIINV